jgi:hypothetical protein
MQLRRKKGGLVQERDAARPSTECSLARMIARAEVSRVLARRGRNLQAIFAGVVVAIALQLLLGDRARHPQARCR